MNLLHFLCQPPKSPFAPQGRWVMAEDMISGVDFGHLKDLILKKEPAIIASSQPSQKGNPDGYTGLGPDSLTSRYESFNVLVWDDPEIAKLKDGIYASYIEFLDHCRLKRPRVWIQCWANVLRKGQHISAHIHDVTPLSYLGGHVVVSCTDTKTVYINPIDQITDLDTYESQNQVGKLTFFQSSIPHFTTEHQSDEPRITIAFDFVLEEGYQNAGRPNNCILFDKGNM